MASQRHMLEQVVVYLAGDSGDGIQVAGQQLTLSSAVAGNDVHTFADYPAEIRAPAGTTFGISGFQLRFAADHIHTVGGSCDVLVALNPAALVVSLPALKEGGILIFDTDKNTERDWAKAGASPSQLEALEARCRVVGVPLSRMTLEAVSTHGLSRSQSRRCKNCLVLGMLYWLYDRPLHHTQAWIKERFAHDPALQQGNLTALQAGYTLAQNGEWFPNTYRVAPAVFEAGTYRSVTGNQAAILGLLATASTQERNILLAGYPITPASDLLHQAARHQEHGITTFQAEDEIAAMGAVLGAAFGGHLGVACTSGPGLDLKQETLGLGVMAELPAVLWVVQRAGPATGMPTKVEQADLNAACFGRHGQAAVPVLAPATPSDHFAMMQHALTTARERMTPVIVLSDGALAHGAEPWRLPEQPIVAVPAAPNSTPPEPWLPYARDPKTGARPWVPAGTPQGAHRIGGLEKTPETGAVSSQGVHHETMMRQRRHKIETDPQRYPEPWWSGPERGDLLVIAWGSTYGVVQEALRRCNAHGIVASHLHLRTLWPIDPGLKTKARSFQRVVCVELNEGQLCAILRAQWLLPIEAITQTQGQPFSLEVLWAALEVATCQA